MKIISTPNLNSIRVLYLATAIAILAPIATAQKTSSTPDPNAQSQTPEQNCQPMDLEILKKSDPQVHSVAELIINSIKNEDAKTLQPLFHPRLNVTTIRLEAMFRQIKQDLSAKKTSTFEGSFLRTFLIHKETNKLVNCDSDQLRLNPSFGYDRQYFIWIQLMGDKELGRLMFNLVPAKKSWAIAASHYSQWTYLEKNADHWAELAQSSSNKKEPWIAWMQWDLARKLSQGGGIYFLANEENFRAKNKEIEEKTSIVQFVQSKLKDEKIQKVSSIFSAEGPGIMVRLTQLKEESTKSLRTRCEQILKTLLPEFGNTAYLAGGRCVYASPNDKEEQDGSFGSFWVNLKGS